MKSWSRVELPKVPTIQNSLRLFSTDMQSKVELGKSGKKQIYVCGITPYDATHLGHAATYLTFDILIRFWMAQGNEVNYIQNITDIDDPLLERANRDGIDWMELANSQIDLFRSDMSALRIIPPTHYEGAVDAIPEVISAIQKLENLGITYSLENDRYFDVSKDEDFGFESHLNEAEMLKIFAERGGDPNREGKRNPLDSLLWSGKKPGEPFWHSPFGEGRPGWHIECAAIAVKFAEKNETADYVLDVQGGGSDLIFPHHEMSASQSKFLVGKKLAQVFVHAGLIGLDGEKMSKSKGNLLFVSKMISSGISPMAIRWALLKRHYRQDYLWQRTETQEAERELASLAERLNGSVIPPTKKLIEDIYSAIADDLNTPMAISKINQWVNSEDTDGDQVAALELRNVIDAILGIELPNQT
ncbi:MAG: hypothetical protein RL740_209 [Actinomycetota bacterium]